MGSFLLRILGHRAAKHVVKHHVKKHGTLDVKYGFSLFKDPRVPVGLKAAAIGIAFVIFFVIQALELPLEALIGLLLPIVGVEFDFLFSGVEFVLLPGILACLILPQIVRTPKPAQARILDMAPPMRLD